MTLNRLKVLLYPAGAATKYHLPPLHRDRHVPCNLFFEGFHYPPLSHRTSSGAFRFLSLAFHSDYPKSKQEIRFSVSRRGIVCDSIPVHHILLGLSPAFLVFPLVQISAYCLRWQLSRLNGRTADDLRSCHPTPRKANQSSRRASKRLAGDSRKE